MSTARWRTSPLLRAVRSLLRNNLGAAITTINTDLDAESISEAVGYLLPTVDSANIQIARNGSKGRGTDTPPTPSIWIEAQPTQEQQTGQASKAEASVTIAFHVYLAEGDLAAGPTDTSETESIEARLEQAIWDLQDAVKRTMTAHATGLLSVNGVNGLFFLSEAPTSHTSKDMTVAHGRASITITQERDWV